MRVRKNIDWLVLVGVYFLVLLPAVGEGISFRGGLELAERLIGLSGSGSSVELGAGNKVNIELGAGVSGLATVTAVIEAEVAGLTVDARLGQLYGDLTAGGFMLRVGKQELHWGRGFSWNPTNYFGAATKLDFFAKPRNWPNLLNAALSLEGFSAMAIAELGKQPENMMAAFQVGIPIWLFELELNGFTQGGRYGLGGNLVFELDNNMFYVEAAGRSGEYRPVVGGGAGAGWTLGARDSAWYPRITGGYYRIFEDTSFLCLEYSYNGDGWTAAEAAAYYAGLPSLLVSRPESAAELLAVPTTWIGQLRQNYVVFIGNVPNFPIPKLRLGVNAALCLDDLSGVATPEIRYDLTDNAWVALNGNFYWGDSATEFGSLPVRLVANLTLQICF